ncbi:hypothetical protein CN326_13880 [Bacillus sp. AFS018417]|uniref:hypothetical protein n=1 Tax=Bacillus sp. AFS018417 TaxID=2033491 RepID=UPI000BF4DB71|nr:hypothetical protein [Bacillus sp. AFS018417]PEZ05549.1 hypothetical protein CN326_13880 [Bacillus sp. AFS018417]
MDKFINFFSNINWQTYFSSILTTGVLYFLFQTWAKEGLSFVYKKKFEEFKKELEQHAEKQKLDFQRKIHDFGLYSSKRHEIYPELYKQILIAQSYILSLRGLKSVPTFVEYDSDDIKEYLGQRKVLNGKINEIVEMWERDKERAIKEVNDYMKIIEIQEAKYELSKAREQLWKNELYLSQSVCDAAQQLVKNLSSLLINYEFYEPSLRQENQRLTEAIQQNIVDLKDKMQEELAIGHYE